MPLAAKLRLPACWQLAASVSAVWAGAAGWDPGPGGGEGAGGYWLLSAISGEGRCRGRAQARSAEAVAVSGVGDQAIDRCLGFGSLVGFGHGYMEVNPFCSSFTASSL